MNMNRLKIGDVIALSDQHSPGVLFGQFLDDFYHAENAQRMELIRDEPLYKEGMDPTLTKLAATAHHLANRYHLPVPDWAMEPKYILPEPFYGKGAKREEYRRFLDETSLPEFKQRNLMLGDNVLSRY